MPRGIKVLRSPYTRVWIIGRTYIKDAADTPNVVRLQNEYSLTPLNRWGTNYRPRRPKRIIKTVTQYTIPDPLLSKLNRVGIGPGLHPSAKPRLDAATRQGLSDSVAAGAQTLRADIQAAFIMGAPKHNGWLVSATGTYGTWISRFRCRRSGR